MLYDDHDLERAVQLRLEAHNRIVAGQLRAIVHGSGRLLSRAPEPSAEGMFMIMGRQILEICTGLLQCPAEEGDGDAPVADNSNAGG